MVGFETSDDACVYLLENDNCMIQTVDFFPPMVDDPYVFGAVAAANALSDIYAMGGTPATAMNLMCIPDCLDPEVVYEIMRGGADKVKEAGAVLAGGHSISDDVPKYGLSVTGFAPRARITANNTAKPGDILILTKPIGSGVLCTALKNGLLAPEEYEGLVTTMCTLNAGAGAAVGAVGANACTDVTGFGLLGHAYEIAAGSGVTLLLEADKIPLMSGAEKFAREGWVPGGAYNNAAYLADKLDISADTDPVYRDLFCDPQTSGGLLICAAPEKAEAMLAAVRSNSPWGEIVGKVLPAQSCAVKLCTSKSSV